MFRTTIEARSAPMKIDSSDFWTSQMIEITYGILKRNQLEVNDDLVLSTSEPNTYLLLSEVIQWNREKCAKKELQSQKAI